MEIEFSSDGEWRDGWEDEFREEVDETLATGTRLLLAAYELVGGEAGEEATYSDLREATGMEKGEVVEWEAELRRMGLVGEGSLSGFGLTYRGVEEVSRLRRAA